MRRAVFIFCNQDWSEGDAFYNTPAKLVAQRDWYFYEKPSERQFLEDCFSMGAVRVPFDKLVPVQRILEDVDSATIVIRLVPSLFDEKMLGKLRRWFVRMFDLWRRRTPDEQAIQSWLARPRSLDRALGAGGKRGAPRSTELSTPFHRGFGALIGENNKKVHTLDASGKLTDFHINVFYKNIDPVFEAVKNADWKFEIIVFLLRNYHTHEFPSISPRPREPARIIKILVDDADGQSSAAQYLKDFLPFGEGQTRCSADAAVPMDPWAPVSTKSITVRAHFEIADLIDREFIARMMQVEGPTILVMDQARESAVKEAWMATVARPNRDSRTTSPQNPMNIISALKQRVVSLAMWRRDDDTGPGYLVVDRQTTIVGSAEGRFTVPANPFVIWDCIWESAFMKVIQNRDFVR